MALAKRVQSDKDLAAAEKLIRSNLYLVVATAFEYRGYGLPIADIISEGNIGLMKAVKKYDPDKGFRLSTYAVWWIKAAINEFILASWSLVRLSSTAATKKLFFGLKRVKNKLGILHDNALSDQEVAKIAEHLKVSADEVREMDARLNKDVSINAPVKANDDDAATHADLIPATSPNQEEAVVDRDFNYRRMKLLLDAIAKLSAREQDIIRARRMQEEPATLDELASRFEISKERVRQIENNALDKLKSLLAAEKEDLVG